MNKYVLLSLKFNHIYLLQLTVLYIKHTGKALLFYTLHILKLLLDYILSVLIVFVETVLSLILIVIYTVNGNKPVGGVLSDYEEIITGNARRKYKINILSQKNKVRRDDKIKVSNINPKKYVN